MLSFPTRERGLKCDAIEKEYNVQDVVPHAGTWIEIKRRRVLMNDNCVVPHAGTWIEIAIVQRNGLDVLVSFPTRERGLKLIRNKIILLFQVVPHAGTWIEIIRCIQNLRKLQVVPHAGTWIEIIQKCCNDQENNVVPHAGTWIEIVTRNKCGY